MEGMEEREAERAMPWSLRKFSPMSTISSPSRPTTGTWGGVCVCVCVCVGGGGGGGGSGELKRA